VMVDTGKEGGEKTVIFSRFRKRLLDRARELQPGQRVSISYVREMGFLWASEMELLNDEPPSDIDTDKVTEDLPTDVAELQRRVKALATELERLRLENEKLRRELELLRDAREKPEAVADAKAETDTKDIFEDEPEKKGVDPLAEPITARGALRANVQKYVGTVIKESAIRFVSSRHALHQLLRLLHPAVHLPLHLQLAGGSALQREEKQRRQSQQHQQEEEADPAQEEDRRGRSHVGRRPVHLLAPGERHLCDRQDREELEEPGEEEGVPEIEIGGAPEPHDRHGIEQQTPSEEPGHLGRELGPGSLPGAFGTGAPLTVPSSLGSFVFLRRTVDRQRS